MHVNLILHILLFKLELIMSNTWVLRVKFCIICRTKSPKYNAMFFNISENSIRKHEDQFVSTDTRRSKWKSSSYNQVRSPWILVQCVIKNQHTTIHSCLRGSIVDGLLRYYRMGHFMHMHKSNYNIDNI